MAPPGDAVAAADGKTAGIDNLHPPDAMPTPTPSPRAGHDAPRPLLPAAVLVPLLVALLGFSLLLPAQATERRARLTIELELDGSSRWQDAGDSSQTTLKRRYRLVTWLRAEGDPMAVNTKAPDYAQTMMARSAQVQSQVAAAQNRAARSPAAPPMDMARQMELAQKAQAACGSDRDCLMRMLAPQVAAQVTPDPARQAQLVRHAQTAREEDDGEDLRYQSFQGIDRCEASYEVRVEETLEGRYADVQGPVPWRITRGGAQPLTADELRLLCLNFNLVLDRRSNAITTDAGFGLPEPRVSSVHTERGRSTTSVNRLGSLDAVSQWVAERTRQAPRAGNASATLPLTLSREAGRGRSEGGVKARLSWKFEEL